MLVLNLITFLNLLVVFLILYFRKDNSLPNKILALILINPGINFLSNSNILAGGLDNLPYLYFFAQATALLFAPLVLVYTNLMTGRKINKKNPLFYLTAATLMLTVYYAVEFFLFSPAEQASYLHGIEHEPYPDQMAIINGIFILMQQAYFTLAAIQVYRYGKNLPNMISNFDKTRFEYVKKFIILIWILNLITIGLYATLPMVIVEYIGLPVVLVAIYSFIIYFSFHHHSIFTRQTFEAFQHDNEPIAEAMEAKESEPEVANDELKQIAHQLDTYLSSNEPFVNPDLTIYILAEETGINHRKISVALNKVLGKTFYDYINEKRVNKSRILLLERTEITIEGVGYESGFNSRASFYRAFKKHAGVTPSQYLESNRKTATA